jgi:hypothetical protein
MTKGLLFFSSWCLTLCFSGLVPVLCIVWLLPTLSCVTHLSSSLVTLAWNIRILLHYQVRIKTGTLSYGKDGVPVSVSMTKLFCFWCSGYFSFLQLSTKFLVFTESLCPFTDVQENRPTCSAVSHFTHKNHTTFLWCFLLLFGLCCCVLEKKWLWDRNGHFLMIVFHYSEFKKTGSCHLHDSNVY